MMPAPIEIDRPTPDTLVDVTNWFFEDYLGRWVSAGASGASPAFITEYWSAPLWVSMPGLVPGVLPTPEAVIDFLDAMQSRLRAAGYHHTNIPDRRITVLNDCAATIEVIWSRRRADESEIERLAVHFAAVRGEAGWRAVAIFAQPTDVGLLDEVWPISRGSAEPSTNGFVRRASNSGVSYLEAGVGGESLLVFVHGYRDNAVGWRWVAQPLVDAGHHVVMIDRRPEPGIVDDSEKTLEAYARQVSEVITEVRGGSKSVVLVGHSMGGGVAELSALDLPGLVRGLALVTPAPLGGVPLPDEVLEQFTAATRMTGSAEGGQMKLTLTVRKDAEVERRLTESTPEEPAEAALQALRSWVDGHPKGLEASSFDGPALIIATEDQFFSEDLLRSAVAPRFANARVTVVRDAGHYPHIEQPTEVATQIAEFLEAVAVPIRD